MIIVSGVATTLIRAREEARAARVAAATPPEAEVRPEV
jgi:hypothetical protein